MLSGLLGKVDIASNGTTSNCVPEARVHMSQCWCKQIYMDRKESLCIKQNTVYLAQFVLLVQTK